MEWRGVNWIGLAQDRLGAVGSAVMNPRVTKTNAGNLLNS